jgi:hypothetical protein
MDMIETIDNIGSMLSKIDNISYTRYNAKDISIGDYGYFIINKYLNKSNYFFEKMSYEKLSKYDFFKKINDTNNINNVVNKNNTLDMYKWLSLILEDDWYVFDVSYKGTSLFSISVMNDYIIDINNDFKKLNSINIQCISFNKNIQFILNEMLTFERYTNLDLAEEIKNEFDINILKQATIDANIELKKTSDFNKIKQNKQVNINEYYSYFFMHLHEEHNNIHKHIKNNITTSELNKIEDFTRTVTSLHNMYYKYKDISNDVNLDKNLQIELTYLISLIADEIYGENNHIINTISDAFFTKDNMMDADERVDFIRKGILVFKITPKVYSTFKYEIKIELNDFAFLVITNQIGYKMTFSILSDNITSKEIYSFNFNDIYNFLKIKNFNFTNNNINNIIKKLYMQFINKNIDKNEFTLIDSDINSKQCILYKNNKSQLVLLNENENENETLLSDVVYLQNDINHILLNDTFIISGILDTNIDSNLVTTTKEACNIIVDIHNFLQKKL